jgi:hypothetical protein
MPRQRKPPRNQAARFLLDRTVDHGRAVRAGHGHQRRRFGPGQVSAGAGWGHRSARPHRNCPGDSVRPCRRRFHLLSAVVGHRDLYVPGQRQRAGDRGSASAKLTVDGRTEVLTEENGRRDGFTSTYATSLGTAHTYQIEVKDTSRYRHRPGDLHGQSGQDRHNFGATNPRNGSARIGGACGRCRRSRWLNQWNNLVGPTTPTDADGVVRRTLNSDTGASSGATGTAATPGNHRQGRETTSSRSDAVLMTGYLTPRLRRRATSRSSAPRPSAGGNGYDLYVYALGGCPRRVADTAFWMAPDRC